MSSSVRLLALGVALGAFCVTLGALLMVLFIFDVPASAVRSLWARLKRFREAR